MTSYERDYGGDAEHVWIEMVQVGPHQFVRRDVAVALGLRIVDDQD